MMHLKWSIYLPSEPGFSFDWNYEWDSHGGSNIYHKLGWLIPFVLIFFSCPGSEECGTWFHVRSGSIGQVHNIFYDVIQYYGILLVKIIWVVLVDVKDRIYLWSCWFLCFCVFRDFFNDFVVVVINVELCLPLLVEVSGHY